MELQVVHMLQHELVSSIRGERLTPHLINFRALNAKKRGGFGRRKEILADWRT